MRFSDTTQFHIPKQTKYANSDSSFFNSDEFISDEDSSQRFMTPFNTSNQTSLPKSYQNTPQAKRTPSLTSAINENPSFKNIIDTSHTNITNDRSRHSSQNQTDSLPPPIDRTTKTISYDINPNYNIDSLYHLQNLSIYHSTHWLIEK